MRTTVLLAGATLALLLSGSARSQTPADPYCPAIAATATVTEGAGREAQSADTEDAVRAPQHASTDGDGPAPMLTKAEGSGTARQLADVTPCRPCL